MPDAHSASSEQGSPSCAVPVVEPAAPAVEPLVEPALQEALQLVRMHVESDWAFASAETHADDALFAQASEAPPQAGMVN